MERAEAIDALRNLYDRCMWASQCENIGCVKCEEALNMAIEALSTTNTEKLSSCGDPISRADVLALAEKGYIISNSNYKKICDLINELPSADRPSGEWVESLERNDVMHWGSYSGYCTNCGEWSEYLTTYCGECGVVMYALNNNDELVKHGVAKMGSD